MAKIILTILFFLSSIAVFGESDMPYTVYNYDARYRLGLIDVEIGHGAVTVRKTGTEFWGTIVGESIPWHKRIFCINDTIRATLDPTGGYIEYINGWYMKPKLKEYKSHRYGVLYPDSYKTISGEGRLDASDDTMEAITIMSDMTVLFYYFRVLDFQSMLPEEYVVIPLPSDQYSDKVKIDYKGKSNFRIGKRHYDIYNVNFDFSYKGNMSGYNVKSKIDVSRRIPLQFSAHLPIGYVEMTLNE